MALLSWSVRQGAKNVDGGWGIFSKKMKIVNIDKKKQEMFRQVSRTVQCCFVV